jgi:hypothetical protein
LFQEIRAKQPQARRGEWPAQVEDEEFMRGVTVVQLAEEFA